MYNVGHLFVLSEGQDGSTLERHVGCGTCPLSNKIDKDKELELFSLGFCICNQVQGLVLSESCLPCISVCECSYNFPAKIHCPKILGFGADSPCSQALLFPSARSFKRLSEVTEYSYLKIQMLDCRYLVATKIPCRTNQVCEKRHYRAMRC